MINIETYNLAVQNYSDALYRFIYKSTKDYDLSKDITQDAFTKLWIKKEEVEPEKVKSWLYTTAHNLLLNDIRRKNVIIAHAGNYRQNEITLAPDLQLKDLIDQALQQLPQIQKSVLLLRDLEGYAYDEIGEILELSESQVKVYLFRARVKIKELLKNKLVLS